MDQKTFMDAERRLTEAVQGMLRAVDDVIAHPGATSIEALAKARDEYNAACEAIGELVRAEQERHDQSTAALLAFLVGIAPRRASAGGRMQGGFD